MDKSLLALLVAGSLLLGGCSDDGEDGLDGADGVNGVIGADGVNGQDGVSNFVTTTDVVTTNANIAFAIYSDSVFSAQDMQNALENLVENPTQDTFAAAKQAWLAAREPYVQSEAYRFRVGPIDALREDGTIGEEGDGPEGRINAWPLGEALIDYVAAVVDGDPNATSPETMLSGNIIADTAEFPVLSADVLASLNELDGDERNVATGYHAIEFLLWGQDLNEDLSGSGTRDSSGGQRPVSDFFTTSNGNINGCTSGEGVGADDEICARRGDYLLAAAELLISDLTRVAQAWEPEAGVHYASFVQGGDESLAVILEGMGRLSFGELAGERINIALRTDSQEDEHSCFSDNTHRDIFLDAKSVQTMYLGSYTRIDGSVVEGASINDLLVVEGEPELANTMRAALEATQASTTVIDTLAKTGTPFDVLIQESIVQPNVVAVIANLVEQTDVIEQVIEALNVTTNDLRQDTEEPLS